MNCELPGLWRVYLLDVLIVSHNTTPALSSCSQNIIASLTDIETERSTAVTVVSLLDTCVKKLQEQGMKRIYMDGITEDFEEYTRLGM